MKLNFERKPKVKMTGVRLTTDEYESVKKIAKENNESIGETCRVLIVATLSKIK